MRCCLLGSLLACAGPAGYGIFTNMDVAEKAVFVRRSLFTNQLVNGTLLSQAVGRLLQHRLEIRMCEPVSLNLVECFLEFEQKEVSSCRDPSVQVKGRRHTLEEARHQLRDLAFRTGEDAQQMIREDRDGR